MPNCWCGKVDREAGRWSEVEGLNTDWSILVSGHSTYIAEKLGV